MFDGERGEREDSGDHQEAGPDLLLNCQTRHLDEPQIAGHAPCTEQRKAKRGDKCKNAGRRTPRQDEYRRYTRERRLDQSARPARQPTGPALALSSTARRHVIQRCAIRLSVQRVSARNDKGRRLLAWGETLLESVDEALVLFLPIRNVRAVKPGSCDADGFTE